MQATRIALALLTLSLMASQCAASALPNTLPNTLRLLTEDYPPFNFLSDDAATISGMSSDILREMAKRANVKVQIEMVPWKRALVTAAATPSTCVYSTIRTPDREASYKWIGPLISDNLALFAREGRDIKIESFDAARKYLVGTYNGSLGIPILESRGIKFDVAQNDRMNLQKLAIDRIDLWVASLSTGPYMAKRSGLVGVKPVFIIGDSKDFEMYLACNMQLADELVQRLNGVLEKMCLDGTYAKIQQNYK